MSTEILTITDLTRMSGDRVCIAGYTPDGACVRPELPYGFFTEPWLIQDSKGIVRPFAKVEFKLDRHIPDPPHTEDWVALPAKPRVCGHVPPADRMRFLHATASPDVESIFGATIHHEWGLWVAAGEGAASLGTIKARVWDIIHEATQGGGWEYRLVFTDDAGRRYALSVTDLAFRYFLDHERETRRISGHSAADSVVRTLEASAHVYLRIGLARHWAKSRVDVISRSTACIPIPTTWAAGASPISRSPPRHPWLGAVRHLTKTSSRSNSLPSSTIFGTIRGTGCRHGEIS